MGQKVNPIGLRLGINRTWDSRWFAGKAEYGKLLHEDIKIREVLHKELKQAAVARIVIERPHRKCRVTIHSARPGVVIGKKGADIDRLRKMVAGITESDVVINIAEIRRPELDATLVAESIAQQLERRVAFRRAMKRAVQSAMRLGAEGIRINCSGRLGGAEIARMEWYREGRVPLHTLRADIDYGVATAFTNFGTCGVKVWIFRGEILELDPFAHERRLVEEEALPQKLAVGAGSSRRQPMAPPATKAPQPSQKSKEADPRGTEAPQNGPLRQLRHLSTPGIRPILPPPVTENDDANHQPDLPSDWPKQAERELMEAFGKLSAAGAEKRKAIDTLLLQGRNAMRASIVPRALVKRVSAIMPALFEKLFDSEPEVRWAAAYAISALRRPMAFRSETAPSKPAADVEAAVLNELRDYLKERGSSLVSEVEVLKLTRTADQLDLSGNVKIFDKLPLDIAGRQLDLATSGSADQHVLEIQISEQNGTIIGEYESKSPPPESQQSPLAERDFHIRVEGKTDDAILVRIVFDNSRLRTHVVNLVPRSLPSVDVQ